MRQSPFEPAVVAIGKTEVTDRVRLAILERQEYYPHVTVQIVPYRYYPAGQLAAHVLGYVGKVSGPTEAKKHPGYEDNDTIGRAGVEATYDSYLHGTSRARTVAVDPAGRVVGDPKLVSPGHPGDNVQLTIDSQHPEGRGRVARARHRARAHAAEQRVQEVSARELQGARRLGGRARREHRWRRRDGVESHLRAVGVRRWYHAGAVRVVDRAAGPLAEPGDAGSLRGGLDVQARSRRSPRCSTTTAASSRTIEDNGLGHARRTARSSPTPTVRRTAPVDLRKALTVSSDMYFYTFGNEMWDDLESRRQATAATRSRTIAPPVRIRCEDRHPDRRGDAAAFPTPAWKTAFAKELYYQPAAAARERQLEPRRRHPARRRSGRPRRDAAAARRRVRGVRQRRHAVAAAARVAHRRSGHRQGREGRQAEGADGTSRFDPTLHSALMDGFSGVVSDPQGHRVRRRSRASRSRSTRSRARPVPRRS